MDVDDIDWLSERPPQRPRIVDEEGRVASKRTSARDIVMQAFLRKWLKGSEPAAPRATLGPTPQ